MHIQQPSNVFFPRSRCPACLLQACSKGLFGSGKGTEHTCLKLSQAVATWNGNKISVLVELPACKAHRQFPSRDLGTLHSAPSNCAWILLAAHLAIKAAISWSLQVRPRSVLFNSLLHSVTGFDPTPEQGRTRVVNPGSSQVCLTHACEHNLRVKPEWLTCPCE